MLYWLRSGRGSAWLERLVRDQEVGGSNPLAPTKTKYINRFRKFIPVTSGPFAVLAREVLRLRPGPEVRPWRLPQKPRLV